MLTVMETSFKNHPKQSEKEREMRGAGEETGTERKMAQQESEPWVMGTIRYSLALNLKFENKKLLARRLRNISEEFISCLTDLSYSPVFM